ncbi:hypothetical protein BGZ81_004147, partial [Podila clonocystis]
MFAQRHILPVPPFVLEEFNVQRKPRVLISGGGIGGLALALLLFKANVPFLVFERAKEIKPLGSLISMGSSVAPLFKQLGIWDEFVDRAKTSLDELMLLTGIPSFYSVGYSESIISRPELYDLLFRSVPRERILLNKRVLSFTQNRDNVIIECSDNSSYFGDILVGADGAYSAVRQHLYKQLKIDKKLPASDDVNLPFSC